MNWFGRRPIALVLSVAAVAAAGCGSSSSSKAPAATTPAAPTTPATPSTPSTTTTGANITGTTPISDPAARALLIQASAQQVGTHLNHAQLTQLVDCTIKKFEAAGVKTVGQLAGKRSQAQSLSAQCLKELNIKPK
jgi:hypothetical protein